jgi:multimeric flavodoxin WrbA
MTKQKSIRVLGIVGSPRRGGNTEIMVDEILAGAKEAGALVEKVILNELKITPCQACDGCLDGGECVRDDDMKMLYKKMDESKVWILGSPIYWWGQTAQFKAFMDRWYGAREIDFSGRRVILAIPMGGGHERNARHSVGIFTDVLKYKGMELFETVLAPGVGPPGDVRKHPDVLAKAREAGKKVVKN